MKKILFYTVSDIFVPFQWQLARYLETRGFEAHFAAFLPREHLWLRKIGVRLIPNDVYDTRASQAASAWFSPAELDEMLGFELRKHGGRRADWEARVARAAAAFSAALDDTPFDALFIWNGQDAIGQALATLAGRHNITVVYGENGYFSRTLQLDLLGVNAKSSLNHITLQAMREALARPSPDAAPAPGFQLADLPKLSWRDYLRCFVRRYLTPRYYAKFPEHRNTSTFKSWRLQKQRQRIPADDITLPDSFVFIPFQVHDDTQILLNSPNFKSMEAFFEYSYASIKRHFGPQQKIVVKEHPEDLGRYDYAALKAQYPDVIWLRKFDIDVLIEKAECVFVVNSSVGLQAVQKLRPTVVFGESFYTRPELVFDATDLSQAGASIDASRKGVDVVRQANIKTFIDFLVKRYFVASGWKNSIADGIAFAGERVIRLLSNTK